MPRKISIAEACEIARKTQDEAEKRREAFAEDEARRTGELMGHCSVATGSLPGQSAEAFCADLDTLAQELFDAGKERIADTLWYASETYRRHRGFYAKRQPEENGQHDPDGGDTAPKPQK